MCYKNKNKTNKKKNNKKIESFQLQFNLALRSFNSLWLCFIRNSIFIVFLMPMENMKSILFSKINTNTSTQEKKKELKTSIA